MAAVMVQFTIDQSLLNLLVPQCCSQYGYRPTIPDPQNPGQTIPNPQTPAEFTAQHFIDHGIAVAKSGGRVAADAALSAYVAQVDAAIAAVPPTITIRPVA